MARILFIETATKVCSVALSEGDTIVGKKEVTIANSHAEMLSPFIQELFQEQNWKYKDIDAIAVSKGPGSYTGLRIGVSSAKGLCYSIDKPLISVSTLESMAAGMIQLHKNGETNTLFCPMIDATRMEVYSAIYDSDLNPVRGIEAQIINEDSFSEYFTNHKLYFSGDGADKCKELFSEQSNAIFMDEFEISSEYMLHIANKKLANKEFEDVAYFEPYYLKNFIAGKPRVKGLK